MTKQCSELRLETFFRDYGAPFATLVAVLNTVISVTIGQFFRENKTARIILVAGSAILGAVGVTGTFYSQHAIVVDRQANEARRTMIRENLGTFIGQGMSLMERCAVEVRPPPNQDATEWARNVERYLLNNLGQSYVERFRNSSGLPMTASAITDLAHRKP